MFSRRQKIGRHVDGVAASLDSLNRRAGGDPAHHRNGDWTSAFLLRRRAHATEIALDDARRETAATVCDHPMGH